MGNKNSQNLPFPLHDVDLHLIQQCLGPPHGSRTFAQLRRIVPICYSWAPHIRPENYPFTWSDLQTPRARPIYHAPQTASGSDQPFFHVALDRHADKPADTQSDRWLPGKFVDYRPLSLYCMCVRVEMVSECSVSNGGCSQSCHQFSSDNVTTSPGQRCFCEPGYQLQRDKRTCTGQLSTSLQRLCLCLVMAWCNG